MNKRSKLKTLSLALMAALSLGAGPALADYQIAEVDRQTIIERKTEIPADGAATNTEVYRQETTTTVVDPDDVVDENDAEVAGLSITTLLIFALLAFALVAVFVALSRRERPVL